METNNNKLLEFIDSMADLLHEVTRPLYRKRSEYPIDENALYENSLLSAAEKGSYQRLLERYQESSDRPAAAIAEYCGAMNGVIDERAFSKGGSHFVLTPNLFSYAGRIEVKFSTQRLTVLKTGLSYS